MRLSIETPDAKLLAAFPWAIAKALSYVQTGKSGPVDRHEGNSPGVGNVPYMPCYWAGYTSRSAFYSRDYCHQAAGAHLLGQERETLAMLRAVAGSANESRKWFPLWALNFDGSPFRLDWNSDDSFVREVPAVFELVEQCWRQYLWTGDRATVDDPVLRTYCDRAMTDFIALHDTRRPNGIAEGDGSGDIFRGSATYNEVASDAPLVESGDGIACQYQAALAYSRLLAARGDRATSRAYARKAAKLQRTFQTEWGVAEGVAEYVRGYDRFGRAQTDFGLENSWFMPMKRLPEPGPRTDAYLDFIARSVGSAKGRPSNLEAITYLPGVFFPYNRSAEAWKWLAYIIEQPDKEYPEISFTLVAHVVEGLAGFEPNAPDARFSTISRLPDGMRSLGVRGIPLGRSLVDVHHEGLTRTRATNSGGGIPLTWEARFYGTRKALTVDGRPRRAADKALNGVPYCSVSITLAPGETVTVTAPDSA